MRKQNSQFEFDAIVDEESFVLVFTKAEGEIATF